jgi:hypothetical protein
MMSRPNPNLLSGKDIIIVALAFVILMLIPLIISYHLQVEFLNKEVVIIKEKFIEYTELSDKLIMEKSIGLLESLNEVIK